MTMRTSTVEGPVRMQLLGEELVEEWVARVVQPGQRDSWYRYGIHLLSERMWLSEVSCALASGVFPC